jgi:DNA-binding protein YbaB
MIFGNLGKMGEMLKQAKEMQRQLSALKIEKDENGVKVSVTGDMEITAVEISPGLLSADSKKISENVKKTINAALKEAKMTAARRLGGLSSGMGMP